MCQSLKMLDFAILVERIFANFQELRSEIVSPDLYFINQPGITFSSFTKQRLSIQLR